MASQVLEPVSPIAESIALTLSAIRLQSIHMSLNNISHIYCWDTDLGNGWELVHHKVRDDLS